MSTRSEPHPQREPASAEGAGGARQLADRVLNRTVQMSTRTDPAVALSPREYGPDSTPEEREAIADRVSVVDARILLMREIQIQSPFSVCLMFDRLEMLSQDWDRFAYVVDLTEANRPNPETRAALKDRSVRINPRVSHVAIVVGNNELMRAMARLFAYGMGLASVSLHATSAEAIERARRAMDR